MTLRLGPGGVNAADVVAVARGDVPVVLGAEARA